MAGHLRNQHSWIFGVAALAVWLAMGWPFLQELMTSSVRGSFPVPPLWLLPYALFGVTVFGATFRKLRSTTKWALLFAQFAAVVAMAIVHPKDLMSIFLVITAWQVAMATSPVRAVAWTLFQTLAFIITLSQAPNAHLSYIMALSLVLQLCTVFTAQALRREEETARALAQTNRELRSAQAIVASRVRDAERVRISGELHDAWGHELAALGLQLEIASNVTEPGRASVHVTQAKGLARALLGKVRNAVSTLREDERGGETVVLIGPDGSYGNDPHRNRLPTDHPRSQHKWIFSVAALAIALVLGWPVLQMFMAGKVPVSAPWLIAFALFGSAVLGAIILTLPPRIRLTLLCVQLVAVAAMAFISSWAMMSVFLIIVAWQVATATGPVKALSWVVFQTLVVIGALALARNPDLCWVIGKSFALQLFFVFAAQALRTEAETARALSQTNSELRSAQALISINARHAERLRISRELHDAWGHELTALGLQLEIASHVTEPARANFHVSQAKSLVHDLFGKVRDVVSTLRDDERSGLKDALEMLARSVPEPTIHVALSPGVEVSPEQAHALMRCAQEAVTNAVRHSKASNLWLQVTPDDEGVRLVAHNDGDAQPSASPAGIGLLGMRERLESLGGKLAVRSGGDFGFTVDAWLPSVAPRTT